MKKYIIGVCFAFTMIGCSSNSSSDEITQTAPTIPVLNAPENNLECSSNQVVFEWEPASDAENDNISYLIEVAIDDQFESTMFTSSVSNTQKTFILEEGLQYYWRVSAIDSYSNISDYSDVFTFYTGEAAINYLPEAPTLISPELNSSVETSTVDLIWSATDNEDSELVYDIFLDTQNPPLNLIEEDLSESSLNVSVTPGYQYFWRVVAKDTQGGQTIGQVWFFQTN